MLSFTGPKAKRASRLALVKPITSYVLESLENRRLLSVYFSFDATQPLTPSTDIHVSALAGDETEPQI
jgi:hypothetical protein